MYRCGGTSRRCFSVVVFLLGVMYPYVSRGYSADLSPLQRQLVSEEDENRAVNTEDGLQGFYEDEPIYNSAMLQSDEMDSSLRSLLDGNPTNMQAIERMEKRDFSPWNGKRKFDPWSGKKRSSASTYDALRAAHVNQQWRKSGVAVDRLSKRRFSPWSGKRSAWLNPRQMWRVRPEADLSWQ